MDPVFEGTQAGDQACVIGDGLGRRSTPVGPLGIGTYPSSPCSERVRGRLPLLEALRDELYTLLLASAIQHQEV